MWNESCSGPDRTSRDRRSVRVNGRVRAFVALQLCEELRAAVERVQDAVRRNIPGGMRWVQPDNFHLTIRFLGDLDEAEVAKAAQVVRDTRFSAMTLRLGDVSAFPSISRPRVLWVGLESEGDRLQRFADEFERRLGEAAFPPADKPWKSHLTLGRVSGTDVPRGWNRGISPARETYRVDTLSLMQSDLSPSGARHTPLVTVIGTD